jgi:uncharacterized protein (TIGR03083 family)
MAQRLRDLVWRNPGCAGGHDRGVRILDAARCVDVVAEQGIAIGRLCRAGASAAVASCPGWTGAELLAHLVAYQRWLTDLVAGAVVVDSDLPLVTDVEAADVWDAEHAAFVDLLRGLDPGAPVPNWASSPDVAEFWQRRSAQEFAVHRWDAGTTASEEPAPIPAQVSRDGIEEYFDAFVATAVAADAPHARQLATLRFDLSDLGVVRERHVRAPGPVTVLRGTASDLLLGLWHRRDPSACVVDGDRALLADWPRI